MDAGIIACLKLRCWISQYNQAFYSAEEQFPDIYNIYQFTVIRFVRYVRNKIPPSAITNCFLELD